SKSSRAHQPFVKIDCATLPGDLLEAELFGYERGAFTGATESKPGRLEGAGSGTLVLDEIAHLSVDAQAKLLRVIEEREFERLGGRGTIKLKARLIALTNVDLDEAVKRRDFRADLYYRLNVIHIRVPALRERDDDLSSLVKHFISHYSTKHGRKVNGVSKDVFATLQEYEFPGNARELANIVERSVIIANGKRLEVEHLPPTLTASVMTRRNRAKPLSLAQLEAAYIADILAASGGNKTESARILGISRKNLYEKIARYKLNG
ncbi:MAG TPA: sigma-54 dependent transcriptional regulator, partial [Pyrinomonadaceae bacterium]